MHAICKRLAAPPPRLGSVGQTPSLESLLVLHLAAKPIQPCAACVLGVSRASAALNAELLNQPQPCSCTLPCLAPLQRGQFRLDKGGAHTRTVLPCLDCARACRACSPAAAACARALHGCGCACVSACVDADVMAMCMDGRSWDRDARPPGFLSPVHVVIFVALVLCEPSSVVVCVCARVLFFGVDKRVGCMLPECLSAEDTATIHLHGPRVKRVGRYRVRGEESSPSASIIIFNAALWCFQYSLAMLVHGRLLCGPLAPSALGKRSRSGCGWHRRPWACPCQNAALT